MRYIKEPSRDFIFHSVFRCVLNVSVVRAFARLFISMIRFFVLRRRRLLRLIFCLYLLWSIILGVFIGFVLKNWMFKPMLKSGRWFKKERSHIHWDWAHKMNILTNVRRSAHRIPNKHNVRDSPKKKQHRLTDHLKWIQLI